MNDHRAELITTFTNQFRFSKNYSPLYASLFAAAASWLDQDSPGPVGVWLLEAAHGRRPLDLTILLAAGLHQDILLEVPELSDLARYYPSVGGTLQAGRAVGDDWHINQEFKQLLNQAIFGRREQLQSFIQTSQVQTNETGRGISWLFPVSLAGWPRIHLLDLGASAGLNLTAEKRHYQFIDPQRKQVHFSLGTGKPAQFEVLAPALSHVPCGLSVQTPQILSRLGCDMNPFSLSTPMDEVTLAAFVWADQVERMKRLQEGLAAFRLVEQSPAPVELHTVELPGGLADFLERQIGQEAEPLVCYNTFIRLYLPEKGFDLRRILGEWASRQNRPIVWIQWEPPSSLNDRHGIAPEYGWLAWTIDLWHRGQEQHWHIAWVHPHGQQVRWLPDLENWLTKAKAIYSAG